MYNPSTRVKRVIIVDLRSVSDSELDRNSCSRRASLRCFNPFRSEIMPGAPVSARSRTYKVTAASARDVQDLPDLTVACVRNANSRNSSSRGVSRSLPLRWTSKS